MSGGRGGGDRPLTYDGVYDATRTYVPREVVTEGSGVYMALARSTGATPSTSPASWLPLGGGGVKLWVGTSAPTDGSVFWYDTDATC